MREQTNECRTEPHLQLQWLQQEVQRQGRELDAVESKLKEQKRALDTLRAQLAVVMGSWRSEVHRDLEGLIRAIDSTNDTRTEWEQLRRQVERASPEFARHAAEAGAALTPFESKVWMLMGLKLSTTEIATVLKRPPRTIAECREEISEKLRRVAGPDAGTLPVAGAEPALTPPPRRQATTRGRR